MYPNRLSYPTKNLYQAIPLDVKFSYGYVPNKAGILVGIDYYDNFISPTKHILYDQFNNSERVLETIRKQMIGGHIGLSLGSRTIKDIIAFNFIGGAMISSKRNILVPNTKELIYSTSLKTPNYFFGGTLGFQPLFPVKNTVLIGFIVEFDFRYIMNNIRKDVKNDYIQEKYNTYLFNLHAGLRIGFGLKKKASNQTTSYY
jgi:hypothetical protein